MKAIDNPFTKLINGTTQFVIPVFQRDYSWTEDQCLQLWMDILDVAADGSEPRHFLGSIVYVSTGDSGAGFTRWLLVDGQQRMTTLALLLLALRDHISETNWEASNGGPSAKKIDRYFLRNPEEEGDKRHKLMLRRHDHDTLRALVDGDELPNPVSERILESYEFFRERLADVDPEVVYRGIGRLVVVDVTLDKTTDDPQLVFESLNSTGMDLSQSDLIRNYILMRLPEQLQTDLYEKYWSKIEALFRASESTFDAFARDFLALKTEASRQEKGSEIYRAFRRFFPGFVDETGALEAALDEMLRFARYYAAFTLGADTDSSILDDSLRRLRRLVDVPAVLVMRLFEFYDRTATLSEEDFVSALGLLESYVFRRAICGLQTRNYWQTFSGITTQLVTDDPLTDLKVALARQHESYRFPSDADFRKELEEREIYGLRVCSFLLDRLENFGSKEVTDTSTYSVEHVMPQNPALVAEWREMLGPAWEDVHQRWLHRLGNLTLTGYNSKYSDRPFSEKKSIEGGFEDSSVRLNKYIASQDVWTEAQMYDRGRLLARKALKVWPPLHVDRVLIEEARHREIKELAAKRDATKVKMSTAAGELFAKLREKVLELDSEIVELPEARSISYHGPRFFLEVLPRKNKLTLLLDLDFAEAVDPEAIAEDATTWSFFFYAKHQGGVAVRVKSEADIEASIPLIQQALAAANE